ncbi:MAG: hypothetical protein ACMUIU_08950 [bacterium]
MLKPDLKSLTGESKKDWHIFIVTVNSQGIPCISYADQLIAVSGKELVLECCSCSEIMANLWENSSIKIVVWNSRNGSGFQLETRLLQKKEIPKMDGNTFIRDCNGSESHVRMYLLVEIEKIIKIKKISHTRGMIAGPGWIEYSGKKIVLGAERVNQL